MLEGKSSGEGLDGYEEDDDMMTGLVRELLDEGGGGESADAIWQNLTAQRARIEDIAEKVQTTRSMTSMIGSVDTSLPALTATA